MTSSGFLIVVCVIGITEGYRSYLDVIPNGDIVPHPCKPNYLWRGVGHMNPLGGGDRNPFGRDFVRYKKWTPELCRMDSDGDDMTNGEELGDPDCIWTQGTTPSRTKGVTHPGVCDPWGSDKCKDANKLVTCDTGEFICEGLDSPDVINITLRFPPTPVPAKETTYICFTFELDMLEPGVDYHLIASEPFTDNAYVMHHTSLTGCDDTSRALQKPEECNMADSACQQSLVVWTLGMPGECIYHEAGFKIGRSGLKRLNMQHHWTNPELKTNYVDSSGLILYLTKKLRKYNAGYFYTGSTYLEIPPGENRVVQNSTCSAECTQDIIKSPVYLMTGWNHMHYLGYRQNVEHFRKDQKLGDLTPDEVYSYDNPIVHSYDPLVELRPGDRLETTCVFRSTSRTKTTTWGDGTYDEMCFGIFTYFPAENMISDTCTTWNDIEFCRIELGDKVFGCDFGMLFNTSHPERNSLFSKVLDNCYVFGPCRKECIKAVAEVRTHPCFAGKVGKFTEYMLKDYAGEYIKFLGGLKSCECSPDDDDDDDKWPLPNHTGRLASSLTGISFLISVFTIYLVSETCH